MSFFQNLKYFWDGDWLPNGLSLWPTQATLAREPFVHTRKPQAQPVRPVPIQVANGYPTPAGSGTGTLIPKISSGKRPASPRTPISPSARKKPKTSVRLLRKRNGRNITTTKAINPEGVAEGRISKRFPSTRRSCSPKGFPNPGNRCYRNAALQALLHVPAIYHLLGNIHRDCDKSVRQCVTCALQDLCQRYRNVKSIKGARNTLDYPDLDIAILRDIPKTPIKPDGTLHDLVGWHNGNQDDSMLYIRELERHIISACDNDDLALFNQVLTMTRKAVWICTACGEKHISSEQSSSFQVPLNTPEDLADKTLADLMHHNLFTEQVRLRCETETCQVRRAEALISDGGEMPLERRNYYIVEAPDSLIVVQNRFVQKVDNDGKNMFEHRNGKKTPATKKWMEDTLYEEYLNLGRYTEDDNELFYRLDAVVGHEGDSVDGGHYITAVRQANGIDFAVINDAQVKVGTTPQLLERVCWGQREFEPYILFYSKV